MNFQEFLARKRALALVEHMNTLSEQDALELFNSLDEETVEFVEMVLSEGGTNRPGKDISRRQGRFHQNDDIVRKPRTLHQKDKEESRTWGYNALQRLYSGELVPHDFHPNDPVRKAFEAGEGSPVQRKFLGKQGINPNTDLPAAISGKHLRMSSGPHGESGVGTISPVSRRVHIPLLP